MVSDLLTSSVLASVMVWPMSPASKVIVSPADAPAMTPRKVSAPESPLLRTVRVAACAMPVKSSSPKAAPVVSHRPAARVAWLPGG